MFFPTHPFQTGGCEDVLTPQTPLPGGVMDDALGYAASPQENVEPELLADLNVQPRPYQMRIVTKAVQMFEGRYQNRGGELEPAAGSVMIESPTGSGKTVMGLTIARALQRKHGYRVGWVAMRRNLLAQADEENRQRGFGVEMELISMFDKNPPPVDMLIIDEAQHDAAMSMANLHCQVRPKVVLGLTATPFRTDRIKLCFDQVIKDAGIHQLIQDGYLSRYHHYTIPEYSPAAVAQHFLADRRRWGKSLIFFHRLDQCGACHQLLAAAGVKVEVVTAKTNRNRQLEDFSAGGLEALINMAILTEGFDCPQLKTVFCRPSGKSCTIQMAGRVFRRHEQHPVKQVVQCKDTPHPMLKTALADEQYVWTEQSWRSLSINKNIEEITNRMRKQVAHAEVQLPRIVSAHRAKSLPWRRTE